MLGVKAGEVGTRLTTYRPAPGAGRRRWIVVSWIWLYAPLVKSVPS